MADNIQSTIRFSLRSFDYYLDNIVDQSFFISPTDYSEIEDLILNLKIDKSEGPNGIPTKILHLLKKESSPLLSYLFNCSFSTGTFPSILKIGKVIPIHKKLSKQACNNYRPITILSNLDKS